MRHQWQADFVGDLQGDVEWHDAGIAAGRFPDPYLDAQHQVLVLTGDACGFAGVEQAHVGAFAYHHRLGESEDAGEGHVQERQDAHRRRLDHVLAKAREIAGPGAASVDEGRDAAGARHQLGLDAERGAAPVDMRVQVDQAGRDDLTRDIPGILAGEAVADRGDLAAREGDVRYLVDSLRGVDDATPFEYEIVHLSLRPGRRRARRRAPPMLPGPA